jgi:OFA family oxalate/formate antiporter-like MFS transporter
VSAVLGSIHAFSVFLHPLENQFSASRSSVSLTYSFALVMLTIAVLFGPKIYARTSGANIMLVACFMAAIGTIIAGMSSSLWGVWLGYSLIFGLANGLGYGYGLQISAQENPGNEGLAMGIVTASYALGAVLSPKIFTVTLDSAGFLGVMFVLALVLIILGVICFLLMKNVDVRFRQNSKKAAQDTKHTKRIQYLLWLGYFGAALAGLMIIGHAAGISSNLRPNDVIWLSPVVVAGSNLFGSLCAGKLADRMQTGRLLCGLTIITICAIGCIILFGKSIGFLIALGAVGFAYGGTISVYPSAISKMFGIEQGAIIYGKVFTAWGVGGLLGPWLAGVLFDLRNDYQFAFFLALVFSTLSLCVVIILSKENTFSRISDTK